MATIRWKLDSNRFFDPDPGTQKIAQELYQEIKDLPIISPHGHTDPKWFVDNEPFSDPTELILIPDHYLFRMLYSQGIPLESLGIPARDGTSVESDHRKIWQIFADHFYLFAGTPSALWLQHELVEVFGVTSKLCGETAMEIYDSIREKLDSPEYLPRALFERFNIAVLTTTDGAEDSLSYHQAIRDSGWNGRVVPCFRPDGLTDLSNPSWKTGIENLGHAVNMDIHSYPQFIQALEKRREYFKSMGAVSTDHAVLTPYTHRLSEKEAETLFGKALAGKSGPQDAALFSAHMLMEMARMSIEDGMVMQIHPGSFRNHNQAVYDRFGPDKGCDIPVQTEYTRNLYELLNAYGNHTGLTIVVFTMDETAYARELAPLAGHYPAMKLGPPWWFHDSPEGMIRFRQQALETAGIYNTVGFNDDTRAFPSIPARHDLARRMDCNFLAGLVARSRIDKEDARVMARALTHDLVKSAYHL